MLGWLVLFGMMGFGVLVGAFISHRFGRGAQSGMSVAMESESASYLNHTRNTQIGSG